MGRLSQDRFLDGRLNIWQPRDGYRAGVDAVFLAASVDAKAGQSVLELGCGVGVASLCLGWRVPGLDMAAIELQDEYAELARRNGRENGIEMLVETGDLAAMPASLRSREFDHVFANPPYFQRHVGTPSRDAGRNTALAGDTPLADWIDAATRRLRPGGYLNMTQKADRLPDVLAAMDNRLGDVVVKPFAARNRREAELVIVQARKGARGVFRLAAPLILHRGDRHEKDGESYSDTVRAILRNGAALEIR